MAQEPGAGGWLKKVALSLGAKMAGFGGGVTLNLSDPRLGQFFGGPTITGHTINDESAMRITTAFACVRVLAETVGAVTMQIFERQDNGNAKKVDHDLGAVLIEKPNADMRGLEYREAKTTNLAARGNAYSLIERNGLGNVSSLYPVPASKVMPKRKPDGSIVYSVNDRGRTEELPPEKIWHWKGFGYNGLVGLSPIECARQAMGLALAGEEANARLFANGMVSSAIIKVPTWLKPDQRVEANKKLAEMHAGLVNHGKPYLLEGGMEAAEGIFAPRDAQFLELRKMQIPELCRLWRISPHMIADLERATNNNIEQLSLEFVMYTMLPYFRRIEEKATELFKLEDRKRFFVRFNYESLLRADSAARAELYSILLQNGVYSRNEVRALENRNSINGSGMDDYTVQTNMTPVDKLAALVMAQTAKKEPVAAPPQKTQDIVVVNQMPESEQSAIAAALKSVHEAQRRANAQASETAIAMEKLAKEQGRTAELVTAAAERTKEALAAAAHESDKPKRFVEDKAGNVIGIETVGSFPDRR